jgi:2,4-dienoyl-CoA reductase-like NADH-dependent reductase (Old Yellow Enzyme family)
MERNYCDRSGLLTQTYIDYLSARAAGGCALVFTEASYVRADGKGRARQMAVDRDECMDGIGQLAEAVHHHDALLGVELNHGGRTAQARISGFQPVAPTPIPCIPAGGDMPLELDRGDIYALIDCFAAAASRCAYAGVDVLTVHGAHGYLLHQFMSSRTNSRSDEFGEPTRFFDLVMGAVRQAAPAVALGLRISALEGTTNGLDAEQSFELLRDKLGDLDFVDVSAGSYEAGQWIVQPGEWSQGLLAPYAERYRSLELPTGVAGRITSPHVAENIIRSEQADFVSLARTLHADPEWPRRVLADRPYRPCIACNLCIDLLNFDNDDRDLTGLTFARLYRCILFDGQFL